MKALEQDISSEISFIIQDNEKSTISQSIQNSTKNRILEHVRNGTDVILVTSAKHSSEPISLERYFSDNNEEIRTICLDNSSFNSQPGQETIDLSMISAVVYESIHLDTHFAIIVDNADEFPIQALNELIRLALGINTSKNNVNFIFSGSPSLLGIIEQISDIRRLSLAHCSLDTLSEQDIQNFIDLKQSNSEDKATLKFNKYALNKISTFSKGSLTNASIILEWIRLYSIHVGNSKITSSFIDELIKSLEDTSLLSSYPLAGYKFTSASHNSNSNVEKVEFTKPQNSSESLSNDTENTKTVYVESKNNVVTDNANNSNVYEKVMGQSNNNTPIIDDDAYIGSKTHSLKVTTDVAISSESEYEDNYRIEALEQLNDPLPYANEDLPLNSAAPIADTNPPTQNSGNNKTLKFFVFLFIVISIGYFLWSNQLINKTTFDSLVPNSPAPTNEDTSEEKIQIQKPITREKENTNPDNNESLDSNSTIDALVELANKQIDDKKLTTPKGDNAFETFKLILEFQPTNKHAHAGIEKIKTRYETWAKLDINDGKIKRAKYFLSRAIEISPENDQAKQLLASLEESQPLTN